MEYVAFEIGRGGPKQPRPPVAELFRQWNQALDVAQSGTRFVSAFGATGNYVLSSVERQSVSSISTILQQQLRRRFVVFASEEFLSWIQSLERELSEPPTVSIAREPNRGAVMDLNPAGAIPGPLPAPAPPRDPEAWASSDFAAGRVRGVWKNDVLGADGRLDRTKRDGTWGALSQAMKRAYGGAWTARSFRTLVGLARKVQTPPVDIASHVLPTKAQTGFGAGGATGPSQDVSTLLRSVAQPPHISRAIGTLLEAYDANRNAIHMVVQARKVAELLARQICEAHGSEVAGRQFMDFCRDIANRNLLTHKQQTYLNTLRKLGNFAAHEAREADIGWRDVDVVLSMLLDLASATRVSGAPSEVRVDAARLRQVLGDSALIQLYRELAEEDLSLVEEGMADYRRQLKAADGA